MPWMLVGGAVCDESTVRPTWLAGIPCDTGACVEVAAQGEAVKVRSSVDPESTLTITRAEWQAFLLGAKEGLFDHV